MDETPLNSVPLSGVKKSLLSRWMTGIFPAWPSTKLALFLSDCGALLGTFLVAGCVRELLGADLDELLYLKMMLFLLIAPVVNFFNDLYSPTPPALPDELRNLAVATSLAYLGMAIFFFLGRPDDQPSRLVYLGAWLLSLGTVPLARTAVRRAFSRRSWWGVPTAIFGEGELPLRLYRQLRDKPEVGLRPRALAGLRPGTDPGLETLLTESDIQGFVARHRETCALVVLSQDRTANLQSRGLIETTSRHFRTVVLVPEEFITGDIPFWVRPVELGQILGLKIRQNLLDPRRLALKRLMDLTLSSLAAAVLLPFLGLIAMCICIESPGCPFFRHQRLGLGGRPIRILKFRTMVPNAEARLAECLARSPELRAEWEKDQKLRRDPRITRVGRFLRQTSLDELPQLWNVLRGEMSLVGPRPIVENEIAKYGPAYAAYVRVRPGITGLWQVSGRNDLSYSQRVQIDRYYISNWSTWLDLLILARTIPVALGRKGAY